MTRSYSHLVRFRLTLLCVQTGRFLSHSQPRRCSLPSRNNLLQLSWFRFVFPPGQLHPTDTVSMSEKQPPLGFADWISFCWLHTCKHHGPPAVYVHVRTEAPPLPGVGVWRRPPLSIWANRVCPLTHFRFVKCPWTRDATDFAGFFLTCYLYTLWKLQSFLWRALF